MEPICILQIMRVGVIFMEWLDIWWLKKYSNYGFDHFNLSWRKIGVRGLVDCLMGNSGTLYLSILYIIYLLIKYKKLLNI